MSQSNERVYFVIESSGPVRQCWGPYSLGQARHEAGARHFVATGRGCSNGRKWLEGELQVALNIGSVQPIGCRPNG